MQRRVAIKIQNTFKRGVRQLKEDRQIAELENSILADIDIPGLKRQYVFLQNIPKRHIIPILQMPQNQPIRPTVPDLAEIRISIPQAPNSNLERQILSYPTHEESIAAVLNPKLKQPNNNPTP